MAAKEINVPGQSALTALILCVVKVFFLVSIWFWFAYVASRHVIVYHIFDGVYFSLGPSCPLPLSHAPSFRCRHC